MIRSVKCLNCGVEFETSKSWQKFHSEECRMAWHKKVRQVGQDLLLRDKTEGRIADE